MGNAAELWIKAKHRLGESIIWHEATGTIMWVDLLDPALFVHDPKTGNTKNSPLPLQAPIGSIAATTNPKQLIIAHGNGLSLLHLDTLTLEPFCDPEAGRADIIYNDIKADRFGRLWVGTSHAKEQDPRGALWCVKDRKTFALADAGFAVSNGPAFSPDGTTMYFNDSAGRTTFAYDISASHLQALNRRVLRSFTADEGMPDGVVVDSDGNLWCAMWSGAAILQVSPSGALLRKIDVASWNVTTLCFAGRGLRDIHITTATDSVTPEMLGTYPQTGCLFRIASDTTGLPEPLFAI
jgi:sugar lactone lactonase YvrE